MKPEAPADFRGEFRPIRTNVSGIEICEHLPLLAKQADRFSLIRSLSHDSPGHVNSTHTLVTGYPGELVETPPYAPKYPNAWSVISKTLGNRHPGLPIHVANHVRYDGAAYRSSRECRAIVLNCFGSEETQAVSRCEQLRTIALHSSTTGPLTKPVR